MRIPVESLEHSVLQRDANGFCRSFIVLLLRKLCNFTNSVCCYGTVHHIWYDLYQGLKICGKFASLLQEQGHGSIGNASCPKSEQTISKCYE